MYDDTKCEEEEEEQLEGQRWSLKAIAQTFESSKRQNQYRSGIQAAYVVAGMCSCTVFCSSFFNTHVHFIYSNWCVTQTLTLNIQEWKKGKKYSKKKRNFLQWKTAGGNRESRAGEFREIYIIYLLHKSVSCKRGRYGKYFCFVNCACGLNWRNWKKNCTTWWQHVKKVVWTKSV